LILKIVILRQEFILITKSCISIGFVHLNPADAKKME